MTWSVCGYDGFLFVETAQQMLTDPSEENMQALRACLAEEPIELHIQAGDALRYWGLPMRRHDYALAQAVETHGSTSAGLQPYGFGPHSSYEHRVRERYAMLELLFGDEPPGVREYTYIDQDGRDISDEVRAYRLCTA